MTTKVLTKCIIMSSKNRRNRRQHMIPRRVTASVENGLIRPYMQLQVCPSYHSTASPRQRGRNLKRHPELQPRHSEQTPLRPKSEDILEGAEYEVFCSHVRARQSAQREARASFDFGFRLLLSAFWLLGETFDYISEPWHHPQVTATSEGLFKFSSHRIFICHPQTVQ